jgi:hypothetical protein
MGRDPMPMPMPMLLAMLMAMRVVVATMIVMFHYPYLTSIAAQQSRSEPERA